MPAVQALAVLEWGINLVIALRSHCYLMLHAAVVERGGHTLLLPAAPGYGKTTLCTGLALRGWRLFSDEFGLLRPGGIEVTPAPRPMALKNQSIEVIRQFAPAAHIGPAIPGTRKGTVAHVRPPADSVVNAAQCAPARWIVYPRWQADARCSLLEISPAESFMLLATNAFNYELLGERGFDTVRRLIAATRSFRLVYSNLDEAVDTLTQLTDDDGS
jgi:HprK-related kinase A